MVEDLPWGGSADPKTQFLDPLGDPKKAVQNSILGVTKAEFPPISRSRGFEARFLASKVGYEFLINFASLKNAKIGTALQQNACF